MLFTLITTKMSDAIQIICSLTGCTEEEAKKAYDETEDVIEAVDLLLETPELPSNKIINSKKRKREVTPEEEIIGPYRKILKEIDERMSSTSIQRGCEESSLTIVPREEKVQQSNCSQQCLLLSLEEEVQKPETVCQLPFEYSCDSQLNDQK